MFVFSISIVENYPSWDILETYRRMTKESAKMPKIQKELNEWPIKLMQNLQKIDRK